MQRPLVLLTSVGVTHWQANTKLSSSEASAQVESEIKGVIRQRLDALRRGDAKAFSTYFAEDCMVTSDSGAVIEPAEIAKEWANDVHSGVSYKGSDPMDVKVHAYGGLAVATFRLELDEDWAGQKAFGASRYIDV